QKRISIYKERGNPTAEKAVALLQKYLVEPKKRGLEPSLFQQCGIRPRGLMDPAFLDMALLSDPTAYVVKEKERLNTYRLQLLQQTAQEIKRKAPAFAEKCDAIVERAADIGSGEIRMLIAELTPLRTFARSKILTQLDDLASLMEMDPNALDTEIL